MRGSPSRGINRGLLTFTRPVFPSPASPGWNRRRFGFPRASHPAVTGSARRGRGQAIEHGPGTTAQLTSVDLQSGSSLNACDLASHGESQGCVPRRREPCSSLDALLLQSRTGAANGRDAPASAGRPQRDPTRTRDRLSGRGDRSSGRSASHSTPPRGATADGSMRAASDAVASRARSSSGTASRKAQAYLSQRPPGCSFVAIARQHHSAWREPRLRVGARRHRRGASQ